MGYARNDYLTVPIQNSGLPLLKLTKENGLTDFKSVSSISKNTRSLMLIPASSLQEFLLRHSTLPKAKELGDKLYEILSKSYTVQPELYDGKKLEDHPLAMQIHTETEALGLGKEYSSWYFTRGFKSRYLRSWNRRERKYNWLMNQSLGFYFSFHLR